MTSKRPAGRTRLNAALLALLLSLPFQVSVLHATAIEPPCLIESFGKGEGNYRGSPIAEDINGDGRPEIIWSTWNRIHVSSWRGRSLWSQAISGRNFSGAVLGNLDGDDTREIIVGDNKGNIHVFNHAGRVMKGWPQRVFMGADIRSIASADVDADGQDEVVVFSALTDRGLQPNMYMFEGNGSVMSGFPHYRPGDPFLGGGYKQAGGYNCSLAVGDITGDGKKEMVCTQDYGSVVVWQANGRPVRTAPRYHSHSRLESPHWGEVRSWGSSSLEKTKWGQGARYFLEFTYSPPAIADIDLDGQPEIIAVPNLERGEVGPIRGSAVCVWNRDRTYKQGFDPAPMVTKSLFSTRCEPNLAAVPGDIQGDERLEILALHVDGTLRAYNSSGTELWVFQAIPDAHWDMSEPILVDVTGDCKAEILHVVSHRSSKRSILRVLNGAGESLLAFRLPFHTLSAPTIADLNGDGHPEMICAATSSKTGKVIHVYQWSSLNPECMPWFTGRGNFRHTACLVPSRRQPCVIGIE